MEARREQPSLPRRYNGAAGARKHLHAGTDTRDHRGPDEDCVERIGPQHRHIEVRFEAVDLAAEGVALDGDVHERGERMRMPGYVLCDEDRALARPPHRHALGRAIAELLDDPVLLCELSDRGALAARDDERVDLVKLVRAAYVDGLHTEPLEGGKMLREVALETEDAGARGQRPAITNRGVQVVLRPGSTRARDRASPRRVRARPLRQAWRR